MTEHGSARRTDPSTSKASARATLTTKGKEACLRVFATWYPVSLAAFEVCRYVGHPGAWRRVSDLKNAGLIYPTGQRWNVETKRNALTYTLTEEGRVTAALL